MNGDYSIFNNSMNGVITLSDGISFITEGQAQHENIIYSNFIKSEDEKTILTNNSLTTETIDADNLNVTNITANSETVGVLNCTTLNVDNYGFYVDGFGNTISSSLPTTMNNTLKIMANEFTLENGNINQIGTTSVNTLKTTTINGSLTCQSDLIQTGGNAVLKNITCDNVTMNSNKSISQSGSGISNSFGTSTISNLVVTTSMTFPASVTIPDAEQTGDLTFTGGARIIQDLTEAGTNYNTFMFSKIAEIEVNGDITQTSGATTLQNTTIEGTLEIQGDITQTAGQAVFKAIGCDQLSLTANKDIFFANGTGRIDQSLSSGTNLLNTITMNANRNLTQSGTGILSQSGTGTNALKNTSITGTLAVSSSSTFTGNVQCDGTLTMGANRSISQPTGTTNNQFQNTTISNLTCPVATITDITATTLSVGNVSNTEIQYLDGVTAPIQSQIDNINSTTVGNATALTGFTYTAGTDTTNIDNNVVIPIGKTLSVGSITDVETNLQTLNTNVSVIDASLNTLTNNTSGITYTTGTDTTTIDNNVTVNKNLVVQGMNIKAEIDALETSFTTGTITSTNATVSQLNATNVTASNAVNSRFLVAQDPVTPAYKTVFWQDGIATWYNNESWGGLHRFYTYTAGAGTQVISLILSSVSAVFAVAVSMPSLTVSGLTTLASLVASTISVPTITSPSTQELRLTSATGQNLQLNADHAGVGNVVINGGTTNGNTIIANGNLTVSAGSITSSGNITCSLAQMTAFFGNFQNIFLTDIYARGTAQGIQLKTSIRTDEDRAVQSPATYFGCWMIDHALDDSYLLNSFQPVPSSVAIAGTRDDAWIVGAGYVVVLYRYAKFEIVPGARPWAGTTDLNSQTRVLNNQDGTTFLCVASTDIYGGANQVGSCRLFYRGVEVTIPWLTNPPTPPPPFVPPYLPFWTT